MLRSVLVTCVKNPRAPAVTSATLCLMAERRGVLCREGKSPAFRQLDRRVRSAIRRDCGADIEARLRTQGSNSLYRVVRPLVVGKRGDTVTLPTATPDEMNSFFVNVGPRIAASLASSGVPPGVPCRLPRHSGAFPELGRHNLLPPLTPAPSRS